MDSSKEHGHIKVSVEEGERRKRGGVRAEPSDRRGPRDILDAGYL